MPYRIPWRVVAVVGFCFVLGWKLFESVSYPHRLSPAHFAFDGPAHAQPHTQLQKTFSLTFETDPDRAKTTFCDVPHKPGMALVQWAVIVDARWMDMDIHIYKFNNCRASPTYEYEVFDMRQPGLPAFLGTPTAAAQSLDALLDVARATVPENMYHCTPIAVKADAMLRTPGEREAILNTIHTYLLAQSPFRLMEKDAVAIIDGKDEAIYAWITANYLLDTITPDTSSYAVLNLGGSSAQIVFEPTFSDQNSNSLAQGERKYILNFRGHTRVLYHSYLLLGLTGARQRVHRLVSSVSIIKDSEMPNPCIARGAMKTVEPDDINSSRTITMVGADVGGFEACSHIINRFLAEAGLCPMKPCSSSGVYHPPPLAAFPHGKVVLSSQFFDTLAPLLPMENKTLSLGALGALAARVCGGPSAWGNGAGLADALHSAHPVATAPWTEADATWAWSVRWDAVAHEKLAGRPEYCLDLTFIYRLLRAYGLGPARVLRAAKQVEGTELGWTLGATIGMLEDIEVQYVA